MSQMGLLIHYKWCTGCQSCEIACKNEHDFPANKWGIKMIDLGPLEMEPKKIEWHHLAFPTSYCDMCEDRVARGEKPACVLHCLGGCMEYGPIEELSKKLDEKDEQAVIFLP